MKQFERSSFTQKIRMQITLLWLLLILMLIYMVVVGELNLGDSRLMTPLAEITSRILFFGGMIWVLLKIRANKKLLTNPWQLKEKRVQEQDERNRFLHAKSGGLVWDILFFIQLFLTLTASLMDMTAFTFTMITLAAMVILKLAAYWFYSRHREMDT